MKKVISHLQRYGETKLSGLLSVCLLAVFVSVAIVACGSSTTTGSGGSTPTATAQVQTQKCGTISTNPRGLPTDATNAQQSEHCFYQAYQHCQNASLIYTLHGIDTSVVRTFTITNHNNQCIITDAMQHSIAPQPLSPAKTYQCLSMTMSVDGLHVSGCGQDGNNGTVILTLRVNTAVQ